jgi:hypothetical protein
MSHVINSDELLQYNAIFGVLICRDCQYAVQKNALESHLLRHKIFRGERSQLLARMAKLHILEPEQVQVPRTVARPIDGLPVIPGFKCYAAGCGHLCASMKRMRRHWSESHGVSNPPQDCGSVTHLQTFFRGTKLKYFEVTNDQAFLGTRSPASEQGSDAYHEQEPPRNATSGDVVSVPMVTALSNVDGDMAMLRYFHQYTNTTSFMLPVSAGVSGMQWIKVALSHALQQRWLMFGLLAITASHLASQPNQAELATTHLEQMAILLRNRGPTSESSAEGSQNSTTGSDGVAGQIDCLIRCCLWRSVFAVPGHDQMPGFRPVEPWLFATTIRSCGDPVFAAHFAANCLDIPDDSSMATGLVPGLSGQLSGAHTPPQLFERLRTLPFHMSEALGAPNEASGVIVCLSAIDALNESAAWSFSTENMDILWKSMALWLQRLPRLFNEMLSRNDPAALIVFAHWLILVERAEQSYWFLKGLAGKMLVRTAEALPDDPALRRLVQELQA